MDSRVTSSGVEVYGSLTPWSEISSITLVREPAVAHAGTAIPESYWLIVIEFVTGDFVEIPEGDPSWRAFIDELPGRRALLIDDLDALVADGEPGETLLWQRSRGR